MEAHIKVLGILHVVFGVLFLLVGLGCLMFFGGLAGVVGMVETRDAAVAVPVLGLIGTFLFLLFVVLSLPGIIAGYGLLNYRPWARVFAIILSALELLNVPIGTALGVYGLWVLLQPATEQLFLQRA